MDAFGAKEMKEYIFIDNWVLDLLRIPSFQEALIQYINKKKYIVVITSFSFVELYNPGWESGGENDRTISAVNFYSKVPCIIVNPPKVWKDEIDNLLFSLDELPVALDLEAISPRLRAETLLRFLRADDLFLSQGKDIRIWANEYKTIKEKWLESVNEIIDFACNSGYLARNKKGEFVHLYETKELFLYSLDFRNAKNEQVEKILVSHKEDKQKGNISKITAVRMTSLIFWYLYVDIDKTNKVKHQKSDIGDIFQLSLLPYCQAFTVDTSMYRILMRIKEVSRPIYCNILTKSKLLNEIGLG